MTGPAMPFLDVEPLASAQELAATLEEPIGARDGWDRAEHAVRSATVMVLLETGPLPAGQPVPPALKLVTLRCARREYDNPTGEVTAGIGSYSGRLPDVVAAASPYLLEQERRMVRLAVGLPADPAGAEGSAAGAFFAGSVSLSPYR